MARQTNTAASSTSPAVTNKPSTTSASARKTHPIFALIVFLAHAAVIVDLFRKESAAPAVAKISLLASSPAQWIDTQSTSTLSILFALFTCATFPTWYYVSARLCSTKWAFKNIFRNSRLTACWAMVFVIGISSAIRTTSMAYVLIHQPVFEELFISSAIPALIVFAVNQLLVVSASYRLGAFGSCYADYFGVFESHGPVTSFPYNVFSHPMNLGTEIGLFAAALRRPSALQILISLLGIASYELTARFLEDPYMINHVYNKSPKVERKSPAKSAASHHNTPIKRKRSVTPRE